MRIIGLDVGSKTIGVAVSDAMGWTAQPIETIQINEQVNDFGYKRLKELIILMLLLSDINIKYHLQYL